MIAAAALLVTARRPHQMADQGHRGVQTAVGSCGGAGQRTGKPAASTDSSAKSHQDNVKSLKAEADASKKLAAQITELSRKENKSAADKALLKSYVEQLNAEYDGLNLSYSEEGDYLNLNTEQMNEYIDAKMALDESNALITRQNDCTRKRLPSNRTCRNWMKNRQELDASACG